MHGSVEIQNIIKIFYKCKSCWKRIVWKHSVYRKHYREKIMYFLLRIKEGRVSQIGRLSRD